MDILARLLEDLEAALVTPDRDARILEILSRVVDELVRVSKEHGLAATRGICGELCARFVGEPALDELDPEVCSILEDVAAFADDWIADPHIARSFDSTSERLQERIRAAQARLGL